MKYLVKKGFIIYSWILFRGYVMFVKGKFSHYTHAPPLQLFYYIPYRNMCEFRDKSSVFITVMERKVFSEIPYKDNIYIHLITLLKKSTLKSQNTITVKFLKTNIFYEDVYIKNTKNIS